MRGAQYHHLLDASPFAGEASTAPRYTLVDLGAYPALLEGGDDAVAGEIFTVSSHVLPVLDDLEGHPDLYRRTLIELAGGERAAGYVLADIEAARSAPRIAGGSWKLRHAPRR